MNTGSQQRAMIPFVKAHACGNDFLIVEAEEVHAAAQGETAVRLCARNTGVGADGVEYLQWTGERSGQIRLANADGSFAEISGNGTRCVAAWMAYEKGAVAGDLLSITTDAGPRECRIVEATERWYEVATGMGVPLVRAESVVLTSGEKFTGAVVSMGNPHFVLFVEDESFTLQDHTWESLGRAICFHKDFPHQTNVEFVRVIDANSIEIRIFERGVGPTSSSGTGTCASAAAAVVLRGLADKLTVLAPGGKQTVEWQGGNSEMTLTGRAELISVGEAF